VAGTALLGSDICLDKKLHASQQVLAAFLASLLIFLMPAYPSMVKSHKLAATAGLGMFATQALTLSISDHGRVILRDVGWVVWMAAQGGSRSKAMVETCLALFAGIAVVYSFRSGLKLIFPAARTRCVFFGYLLHGDWFLGNRWRAMDIIRVKLTEKLHTPSLRWPDTEGCFLV